MPRDDGSETTVEHVLVTPDEQAVQLVARDGRDAAWRRERFARDSVITIR